MPVIDVFDDGFEFEPRVLHAPAERFVLTPVPLLIDEHGQTFFEAELCAFRIVGLPANGFSHSHEFHGIKFLQCRLHQHDDFPPED